MGRKMLLMKKIANPASRQITYSKRRDGILKKAKELSILCDIDVGLLMFSPNNKLTTFARKERIEDVFLHYLNQPKELQSRPLENEEYLCQSLKRLKVEGEMLEKIAQIEDLEEELRILDQHKRAKLEKLSLYEPFVGSINSVHDAHACQQFLTDAIRRVDLKKAKWLHKPIEPRKPESVEVTAANANATLISEEPSDSNGNWNPSIPEPHNEGTSSGRHLSIHYLKSQKHWDLSCCGHSSSLHIK